MDNLHLTALNAALAGMQQTAARCQEARQSALEAYTAAYQRLQGFRDHQASVLAAWQTDLGARTEAMAAKMDPAMRELFLELAAHAGVTQALGAEAVEVATGYAEAAMRVLVVLTDEVLQHGDALARANAEHLAHRLTNAPVQ